MRSGRLYGHLVVDLMVNTRLPSFSAFSLFLVLFLLRRRAAIDGVRAATGDDPLPRVGLGFKKVWIRWDDGTRPTGPDPT